MIKKVMEGKVKELRCLTSVIYSTLNDLVISTMKLENKQVFSIIQAFKKYVTNKETIK